MKNFTETEFKMPEIPKENAFNAIRFLLCLVVVFSHTLGHFAISNKFFLNGHIAVSVFFIISGFWVTKSYFASKDLKIFFVKRMKKIFPMYYFSVLTFSLICFYFSGLDAKEYFCAEYFKYLFWNFTFLNFVHPSLPGCFSGNAVNGALWTIKIEIGFYIILPVIIFIWRKLKKLQKNIFLVALYVLSVAYNMILNSFAEKWHLPTQLSYQLPGFISFFVSGMLIFFNWNFFLKVRNFLIIPAIFLYFLHYFTETEILFPAALAIIIVWAALFFKKLSCIGKEIDFSWGIYLFHFPIMQILFYSSDKNIIAPVFVSAVLGISFMLTFIIEKYIQKKIK